jgi:nucleoside-diphosphate-sugar epimerase
MRLADKKILVTGGTGFIGSHLTKTLVEGGAKVTVLKKRKSPSRRLEQMAIESRVDLIFDLAEIPDVEVIFHLAAEGVHQGATFSELVETNVLLTERLLERSRQIGIETFVLTNSGFEYGPFSSLASSIDERYPVESRAPYAATKLAALESARKFQRDFQLMVPRIFSVYGPYEKGSRLIPYVIQNCLEDRDILIKTDGEQMRDYLYVEDVVDALITLGFQVKSSGEIFNVGSGKPEAVNSLVQKILELIPESKSEVYFAGDPLPEQESWYFVANNEKMKGVGWEPRFPLNEGLTKTISHFKSGVSA